jgi:hypothetical protein
MSIEVDLGFTEEQLEKFIEDVDPDLGQKIRAAFEAKDAKAVVLAMAEADAHMAERNMRLAAQRYMH